MARAALRGIYKRFGDTQALRGASLELEAGEIHALLGENGAGKTTLVRVLYGLVSPDAGSIEIEGATVRPRSPRHALSLGVGLVHQHFMGVPALSVAENLLLGEPGGWLLSRARAREEAGALLREYGLDLDPDLPAERLGVAQQQRLEIVRALSRGARILVLDEPTAVLAPSEVEELLALMRRLRDEGRSLVLISHKLEEITRTCDRVTVLRAGETVATRDVAGVDARGLARLMVGDEPPPPGAPIDSAPGDVALELHGLVADGLDGLELRVRAGEVLALAGIDGNGQAPLEEVLAGVRALDGGRVDLHDSPLSLVSGDRQRTGLVLDLSLEENLVLEEAARGAGGGVFEHGWLRRRALRRAAASAIDRLAIRAAPESRARGLSGGNQQKLCIARALRSEPKVLVTVNPTRGLDLAATAAVRDEIRARARAGTAVLLVSTDLDEVLELGNRIGVLFRGRVFPVEDGERKRERIGQLMLGAGEGA
ncbi:MAG: ATP-binding cassette domain-containing protein [Deltaproteobacteria bacterium]|nr:ATP-binding cassette domain-containing protein [Deltaproteobacteria bacterium]